MSGHVCNARPSPPGSTGSHHLTKLTGVSVTKVNLGLIDNSKFVVQILDQGGLGACELNAWANVPRCVQVLKLARDMSDLLGISLDEAITEVKKKPPELASRLAMYFAAQACGGYAGQGDTGTSSADVCAALDRYGFCRESEYPYTDDANKIDPGNALVEIERLSYDQKGKTQTARVDSEGMSVADCETAIRQALDADLVIAYAGPVDQSFEDLQAGHIWRGPVGPELGGHATLLVGIGPARQLCPYATTDQVVMLFANSWGPTFGDGGYYLAALSALNSKYDLFTASYAPADSGTV